MPTASKMVAAVMIALTMFLAAEAAKAGLPEGRPAGYLSPIVAGIGFLCGWTILGTLTGNGYKASMGYKVSMGNGLRTAVTAVFWSLLAFALWEMLQLSMKMRYDGPLDALLGVLAIMVVYLKLVILPDVLVALGVGGTLSGLFAEWAGRRWN